VAREPLQSWLLSGVLSCALGGCYASNVVARGDRAVVADEEVVWTDAVAADLDGLFESVAIRGDAALSLRAVWYVFGPDGRYTGAALVEGDDGLAFQTLRGRWRLSPEGLALDDAPPARLQAAPDRLRIAAEGGELVLRRVGRP
jgi:hypothetical protein